MAVPIYCVNLLLDTNFMFLMYAPDGNPLACVLSADGKVLETTMDDIELAIVQDYYSRNRKHLEES